MAPDFSPFPHSRQLTFFAATLKMRLPTVENPFFHDPSTNKTTPVFSNEDYILQLLTEAVMRDLLRELALPSVNVIFTGGGRFYRCRTLH